MFQFHEGPIKTLLANSRNNHLYCFNSMKVRLKQNVAEGIKAQNDCFNSMKVRLKLKIGFTMMTKAQFQFHEGPIKTNMPLASSVKL